MKKLSAILLSVLYLVLTTGISLNIHYCGGKIESVSFISEVNSCCCESNEMQNNCCKNKQLFIKFESDQKLISCNTINFKADEYVGIQNSVLLSEHRFESKQQSFSFFDFNPPPGPDIWKLNCAFLYYG